MTGLEPQIPASLFLAVAAVVILRRPLGMVPADRVGGRASWERDRSRPHLMEQRLVSVQGRLCDLETPLAVAERVVTRGRHAPPLAGEG